MKTTKIVTSAIVLTTLGLAAAPAVHAADVNEETYKSTGKIGFVKDTSTTDPVGPIDPDKPVKPTDPVNPGTDGPLSIDYVSNFDFGSENKISGDDTTYNAKPVELEDINDGTKSKSANYLQVTDKRGTDTGWKLSVKQEAQFNNGTSDLDGAKLQMTTQTLNSKNKLGDDSTTPGITVATITTTPGTDVAFLNASAGQGMGTWTDAFGVYDADAAKDTSAKAVSLEVPGNSVKTADTAYTTDLTWTITDANI